MPQRRHLVRQERLRAGHLRGRRLDPGQPLGQFAFERADHGPDATLGPFGHGAVLQAGTLDNATDLEAGLLATASRASRSAARTRAMAASAASWKDFSSAIASRPALQRGPLAAANDLALPPMAAA